jgi:DNA-binding NtrC family response regulator
MDRQYIKETLSTKSVLFVDDEVDITTPMESMLSKYFKDVYISNSGEDGIQIYKNNSVDIVVSDVTMNGISGIEMANELKKEYRDLKIIFITGHNEKHFTNQIEEITPYYLIKPINYKLLFEDIINILN